MIKEKDIIFQNRIFSNIMDDLKMECDEKINDLDIKMYKIYHKSDERDDHSANNLNSYASLDNEVFSLRNLLERNEEEQEYLKDKVLEI
jgi:hypothetical protein